MIKIFASHFIRAFLETVLTRHLRLGPRRRRFFGRDDGCGTEGHVRIWFTRDWGFLMFE
jgi:hypothetical protein